MYPSGFDRADTKSPFLSFVAAEFHQRGTERRRELAQKITSHPFVADLGMRVPRRLGVLDRIESLHDADLPDSFVLKFASGWSSRGVMILERTGADEYFDHMGLQVHTPSSISAFQRDKADSFGHKEPRWIMEELIKPLLGVGAIPFDYKFYCFQGEIGLIVQIDRNSGPPKVVLFDGEFRPLKRGTDYLLSGMVRPGVAVVPLNAPEMQWWAQKLSLEADSPFVSVDMLDSPTGPAFGEFTYSPGGTHRRMFVFSNQTLNRFDRLITTPGKPADHLAPTSLDIRKSLDHPAPLHFRSWAGYAYNGGAKGADRLHTYYKEQAQACDPNDAKFAWYKRLSALWAGVRDRLRQPRSRAEGGKVAPSVPDVPPRPAAGAKPVP